MPKFEIELEITGFKLKVKGERADIPVITNNLREQFAGLIQPAADITQGQSPQNLIESTVQPTENVGKGKGVKRPRKTSPNGTGDAATTIVTWSHDPGKWGTPRQAWTAWQKILWLLYVVDQEKSIKELSGPAIADTFNTHFRQAGLLKKNSMPRDLGGLKQRSPSLTSDRADNSPITWFLTEEGIKEAIKLVNEAKGGNPPPA